MHFLTEVRIPHIAKLLGKPLICIGISFSESNYLGATYFPAFGKILLNFSLEFICFLCSCFSLSAFHP